MGGLGAPCGPPTPPLPGIAAPFQPPPDPFHSQFYPETHSPRPCRALRRPEFLAFSREGGGGRNFHLAK